MELRRAGAVLVLFAVLAAPAGAEYEPAQPPEVCAGNLFSDQIGTDGKDLLAAGRRPERLWGGAGADRLFGSPTRATCLFGGRGNDLGRLGAGGGIAYGEGGSDFLLGSGLDDVLEGGAGVDRIDGAGGRDVVNGGAGIDKLRGGAGDDLLDAEDGRAEIVDCGDGNDLAAADGVDVLFGCEASRRSGGPLPSLQPVPRAARADETVRIRFTAAQAGDYRVIVTKGCIEGTRLRRIDGVRKGETVRVGLPPPPGGWCGGEMTAAVVRGPGEPIARVRFSS